MLSVAWKRFSVGVTVILVALLAVSNAYAYTVPTPMNQVFIAADLMLPSVGPLYVARQTFPSETFVVLQAEGLATNLGGRLFVFFPPTPCATTGAFVTGTLSTNPLNGQVTLTFTGFEPPDPCIKLGAAALKITIGPAPTPPDPCILTLTLPSGATVTYSGKTVSFIVTTVPTTTTATTKSTATTAPAP
jgi:hypothetical protein